MSWIYLSLFSLVTMSFFVICQKWALNLKVSKEKFLLYMFGGLFLGYLALSFGSLPNLVQSGNLPLFLIFGVIIAAFSYVGNIYTLRAMEKAPNPGYVEGIKAVNGMVAAVVAVIFFGSTLTVFKFIALALIPLGLLPLLYERNALKASGWQTPSLLAMLFFAGMVLMVKQMALYGFSTAQILTALFGFGFLGFAISSLAKKSEKISAKGYLAIFLALIMAFLSNYANFLSIEIAPNPGYAQAIFSGQAVLILFLSYLFFKDSKGGDLKLLKSLGVILVVAGIVLLTL